MQNRAKQKHVLETTAGADETLMLGVKFFRGMGADAFFQATGRVSCSRPEREPFNTESDKQDIAPGVQAELRTPDSADFTTL